MTILQKIKENILSVLPIMVIVLLLHFTIAPISTDSIIRFLIGGCAVILGLSLFLLGTEMGILPVGEAMGSTLSTSGRILLVIIFGFLIGFSVTVAEPDLQVLAGQVFTVSGGEVPRMALIVVVAIGAGVLIVVGLLRTLLNVSLAKILIVCYIFVFALALFTSSNYLSVGFDAGGVTTGPMTVPFILAFGVGVAAVRGGKSAHDDSFGMVALASVGPILAVLILGVLSK